MVHVDQYVLIKARAFVSVVFHYSICHDDFGHLGNLIRIGFDNFGGNDLAVLPSRSGPGATSKHRIRGSPFQSGTFEAFSVLDRPMAGMMEDLVDLVVSEEE